MRERGLSPRQIINKIDPEGRTRARLRATARTGGSLGAQTRALLGGTLVRGPCINRGHDRPGCGGSIEAWHRTHDKPLEVTWLCEAHLSTWPDPKPCKGWRKTYGSLLELYGMRRSTWVSPTGEQGT
jgi:hypothetical protein